jgi:hypothetical protein
MTTPRFALYHPHKGLIRNAHGAVETSSEVQPPKPAAGYWWMHITKDDLPKAEYDSKTHDLGPHEVVMAHDGKVYFAPAVRAKKAKK